MHKICVYIYIYIYIYQSGVICTIFVLYYACILNDRQPYCMLHPIHTNIIVLMIRDEVLNYFQGTCLLLVIINSKLDSQSLVIYLFVLKMATN